MQPGHPIWSNSKACAKRLVYSPVKWSNHLCASSVTLNEQDWKISRTTAGDRILQIPVQKARNSGRKGKWLKKICMDLQKAVISSSCGATQDKSVRGSPNTIVEKVTRSQSFLTVWKASREYFPKLSKLWEQGSVKLEKVIENVLENCYVFWMVFSGK